jgi:S1-C subfamily serine protease
MSVTAAAGRAQHIQKIADHLYGGVHAESPIQLTEIANQTQIDKAEVAFLLRKFEGKELVDFDGQQVRLMGAGKSLYEEQCFPEFVMGLEYCLEKYRAAVVRVVVVNTRGDQAAGTGFFADAPLDRIVTNRHVLFQRTIVRIEGQNGEPVSTGPLPAKLAPGDLDLATIECAVPCGVKPLRVDWKRDAARELEEVLVLSYPLLALTKVALYPAIGNVGILGEELQSGRNSLMISHVGAPGSSGGPVISAKGKVIGVVSHEAETQDVGGIRIFLSAIPSHYLGKLLPTE